MKFQKGHKINLGRKGYWTGKDMVKEAGKHNYNWKGGRFTASNGYIKIYSPEHIFAVGKYIYEHRDVYEKSYNIILMPCQVVHHINQDKIDNRIENLTLMCKPKHRRCIHANS